MSKCDFNFSFLASLLKSHFDMGVFVYICCIFSEHLFLRAPLERCLWVMNKSGLSKFFGKQSLSLKGYGLPKQTISLQIF